jgi:hypothetical protein
MMGWGIMVIGQKTMGQGRTTGQGMMMGWGTMMMGQGTVMGWGIMMGQYDDGVGHDDRHCYIPIYA